MIIQKATNTNPYLTVIGNAKKELGESLPVVIGRPVNDICICDYIRCQYKELVFASLTSESYKKDYSDFLFKRLISSDTVEIILQKDGINIETLDDNTFGELYNGFSNGNNEQQLYYGFLVDWSKVFIAHGGGYYNIKANLSILGNESEFISREFRLLEYQDLAADGTVKIESYQDGNIFGSEFDFTGLNWYQSMRITGRFGNAEPQFEKDNYIDQQQRRQQIKSTMSRLWSLDTGLLSWEVVEKLVYNKLLSNRILITDYSIKAENIWRQIAVELEEITKPPIFNTPNKRYNIKFVDSTLIFQKRNF